LPVAIAEKDAGEPAGNFLGHLKEVHFSSRAGWAFDLEGIAVVEVKLQQGAQDDSVHREPDGPAPIGIAAEHAGVGFGGKVADAVVAALDIDVVGVLVVEAGNTAQTVGTEEFFFIEHAREDAAEALGIDEGHDSAVSVAEVLGSSWMDAFHK